MYHLEIENTKYRLDAEWSVDTWLKLHKWDHEQEWLWPKIIELASGAPADLVALLDHTIQYESILIIGANMSPNWAQLKLEVEGHKMIRFEDLTIGQFIDLEVALSRGLETNLDWLISTLYNCDRKEVLNWNYETAFAALQTWYVHRKGLLESYSDLFEQNEGEEEGYGPKIDPAHNWYDFLMVLADEDFLKIHKVVERPAIEALNFIAWKKDQAKKQELEQKRLQMLKR